MCSIIEIQKRPSGLFCLKNCFGAILILKEGIALKIERYVNGKKITFDQMKRYTVKNRTVDAAVERVIKRESR